MIAAEKCARGPDRNRLCGFCGVSAASLVTLSPRAFQSLLNATDRAICPPRCEPIAVCRPFTRCCDRFEPRRVIDCTDLLLIQALREIDLLRSGIENAADLRSTDRITPPPANNECSSSPTGSLDRAHRPIYAVQPIGEVPMASADETPAVTMRQAIVIQVVTNLGTLIDVLV